MSYAKEAKTGIITENRLHDSDTGSPEVQIALLTERISHLTEVILGMVSLEQGITGRIVSVVAVIFLPPTLVASVYGMNFEYLPGLHSDYGWMIATGLMGLSALGTLLFFRWKGWL